MKNLKSIVFSLMAVVLVSVFLSSCEKDEINPLDEINEEITSAQDSYEKVSLFFNNEDLANKSEEEIAEYIKNLNSEAIMNSKNDYLIAEYLTDLELFDTVISEENKEPLSKRDLSNYIDQQATNELQSKFYEEIQISLRCEERWIEVSFPCPGTCWKKITINTPFGSVSSDVPYPCKKTCTAHVKICW